jgi:hypothetical protein
MVFFLHFTVGENMSLKRHPALQPFSREHVVGLFHAHQLMWLSNGRARFDMPTTVANFSRAWNQNISEHFTNEEIILAPLAVTRESIARLMSEHQDVRQKCGELFTSTQLTEQLCYQVGRALELHIRWEEHHFFPEIENTLSEQDLTVLAARTQAMEDVAKHCID